ncbi:MAG TPA: response regulator [Epulopiscium sp.]|nr:response regulator [Candidatus Epulonipiscium sp.]
MLKVFLVEDEFVVREGIKNNIDWAGEGFLFCGEAPDGEIAYKMIQKEQPDIIITDIKMPFMNGLELSRLVTKELPESKIIILSGHEEFTFAQEAIKIGVMEYLLKPISSVELMKVVKQVAQKIIKERMEKSNFERYKKEMEENEVYIKRRLFEDMIQGSLSTAQILERSKELGFEMSAPYYQIVLFKYSIGGKDENFSDELLGVVKDLKDINSKYHHIVFFDRAIEGIALIIKANSLEQLEEIRKKYFDEIKSLFSNHPEINYFGGVGSPVSRLTQLRESYESASLAFARRFILDENAIISSDELSDLIYEQDSPTINDFQLGNLDIKRVDGFLRNGEASEIQFFVEEFLKSINKTSKKSLLFKQYIFMNVYFTVLNFLKEIGREEVLTEESSAGMNEMKEVLMDFQKVKSYITRLLTIAIEQRDVIRTKRYHRMIEQAKEYINEHYADENISLNEVAAYVNISPSHFSTVFSRETGKSFIRYLTDLRMNKAKELLKCSDLRCSEISMAVGYKDPHYFSYLFKKEQNCTPKQYRNMKKDAV